MLFRTLLLTPHLRGHRNRCLYRHTHQLVEGRIHHKHFSALHQLDRRSHRLQSYKIHRRVIPRYSLLPAD